jgi:HAD superfamily hydrolase (TIGR01509 family)
MIKAIIFSLDGVLVDTYEWYYLAFNKALKELTDCEICSEDYEFLYDGLSTEEKLKRVSEERGILCQEGVLEKFGELQQEYMIDLIKNNLGISPQKCSMLATLSVDGMKLACVTSSIKETSVEILGRSGIQRYLHVIITKEDVLVSNPHPNGYWNAMSLLGVLPDETLIIEDSEKGLQAARVTGAHVWEVSNAQEVTWRNLARELDSIEREHEIRIDIKPYPFTTTNWNSYGISGISVESLSKTNVMYSG